MVLLKTLQQKSEKTSIWISLVVVSDYDDFKELMDNKPSYLNDSDIVKQLVENLDLFQDVMISIPEIQAIYYLPWDHANVIIVKVNSLLS
jgi:hypothetical protein